MCALVAELSDGKLYGVKTFVKASGGCSAPAASNADATKSMLGQMKFRTFRPRPSALPEAQIMLRHPQNSGLQMDQLTRLYIPPFFIENLKIWQGDELMVAMDGGIAISEDPNIRFNYKPNGAADFRVEAIDTEQAHVQGRMAGRKIDAVAAAVSDEPSGSETANFRFRLRPPEFLQRQPWPVRSIEIRNRPVR